MPDAFTLPLAPSLRGRGKKKSPRGGAPWDFGRLISTFRPRAPPSSRDIQQPAQARAAKQAQGQCHRPSPNSERTTSTTTFYRHCQGEKITRSTRHKGAATPH